MAINFKDIDNNWTLFLDRDGVINHEKYKDYIHTWNEFIFYDDVKKAIEIFSDHFRYIIVVTNQRGVGKGVTQLSDLQYLHERMIDEIKAAGGKIDAVYFCPALEENDPNRKPNIGMALQAKKDFPNIDFNKSIMVGNTMSDIQFGKNIGAKTVFLPTTRPEVDVSDKKIDAVYSSLYAFAQEFMKK